MDRLDDRRSLASTADLARLVAVVALGAAIAGVLVLLAYAASEVAADPSLTLMDGYWIGRIPWTPLGVGLVVVGSTSAILAGVVWAFLTGGNLRRVLTVVVALPALFWWAVAAIPLVGAGGAWCGQPTCSLPSFDVITIAYSLPETTALLLLLPALIVTVATRVDR